MANQTMLNIEPFVDFAPLLESPEELRARAEEQGYLFFRALLDAESVFDLRRQILEVCHKHGWLDEEAPLMDVVVRDGSLFIEGNCCRECNRKSSLRNSRNKTTRWPDRNMSLLFSCPE